jgi:hypothetical protein
MIPSRIGTKGITVPLENQQNYWVLTLKDRTELSDQITTMRRNLHAVETQLTHGVGGQANYKLLTTTRALSGISEFLALREQELKHNTGNPERPS